MYTYYSKHETEEHMLYAEEMAEALGLFTEDNKPHGKFIHAYLKNFTDRYIRNYVQLYYMNRYGGLKKVYSQKYFIIFEELFKEHMTEIDTVYSIEVNNKTFKVKRNGGITYA